MFYFFIFFSAILISIIGYLFYASVYDISFVFICKNVGISVFVVIVIDLIMAGIVRWLLPSKLFSYNKTIFCAKRKECLFYEKIGIKKWKDKIPELGKLTAFRKNKISDPKNNEYVKRYILEANYGEGVHLAGMLFGFFVIFVDMNHWFFIGLPIAIVNFVYCFLPFAILRYNLPKLHRLYKINEKTAARRLRTASPAASAESSEDEVAVGTTGE